MSESSATPQAALSESPASQVALASFADVRDVCSEVSRKSLACQTANPGAKKLVVCAELINAYKKCRDEQLTAVRAARAQR
jgi:hypothetical protein